MNISDLTQVGEYEWVIPRAYRSDMRVPVRLFATRAILDQILDDKSMDQAVNATTLPGVVGSVVVMPDMHQGYGFPIGGIAATKYPEGVVSPGAIGYDINCGVRLLASNLEFTEAKPRLGALADRLNAHCPSGVGRGGAVRLAAMELDHILAEGSGWALGRGLATEADLEATEDGGHVKGAAPSEVSPRAKARGRDQTGSLGAGNHFIEVDIIDEVFDERRAAACGLQVGCLALQIHCGSRGLGHQVCTDYVQRFQAVVGKHGIVLPDRELVCAPMDSAEGQAYLGAMRAAANFAFANRQVLAHSARIAFQATFRDSAERCELFQVYDVTHNMGKLERHEVDGKPLTVCVHRKGATRAFGPGSPDLASRFQGIGQPVLVPGSMGTASWVLAGSRESMIHSFGSSCHGAGRVWSRAKAKKQVRGDALRHQLESRGIVIRAGSLPGLAEEAPEAYKDVDDVVDTVVGSGIALKVARLRPVIVIKG